MYLVPWPCYTPGSTMNLVFSVCLMSFGYPTSGDAAEHALPYALLVNRHENSRTTDPKGS